MINKVAQDHMDEKFEESLRAVADSINSYVGIVNDTSSKQYDDFN
jgi:low affinity Fe/Cu permease